MAARGEGEAPSSLPPVQLPVVSDSLASSGPVGSQGNAIDVGGESSPDEGDLFGSEDEGPPAAPAPPAPAAAAPPARQTEDADVGERDLFGTDDENEVPEKPLLISGDEGDIDEKALFGSDEDEDGPAKPAKALSTRAMSDIVHSPGPTSEPSDMDERDIFGDISDEEPDKVEDVTLRRRPTPTESRSFQTLRLPNIVAFERNAFNAKTVSQSDRDGYRLGQDLTNKKTIKLLTAENVIRWRFGREATGGIRTDEDGRPQYEANSRVVEWEDGSRTLHVGSETFVITELQDHIALFEENSQDVHVCHGLMKKRLLATPVDLDSKSHNALRRGQFNKIEPPSRTLLMSMDELRETQQLLEIQAEAAKRDEKKRARETGAHRDEGVTVAFLEEGHDVSNMMSIADVKKDEAAKRQKLVSEMAAKHVQ